MKTGGEYEAFKDGIEKGEMGPCGACHRAGNCQGTESGGEDGW